MSIDTLLTVLEKQSQQELESLRQEAVDRNASLRKDYANRLRLARKQLHTRLQQAKRQLRSEKVGQCERDLREKLSSLRWQQAEKYRPLVQQQLVLIWEQHHEELFEAMANKLPKLNWSVVRVAAQNLDQGRKLFPHAEVIADPELSGGLVAECKETGLTVDCSLGTCMKILWPSLVIQLIEEP